MLSPPEVYLTETSGNFFLKPSRTSWKFFCSGPVQMPTNARLPLTADFEWDAPLAVVARAVSATIAAPRASTEVRSLLIVGSFQEGLS